MTVGVQRAPVLVLTLALSLVACAAGTAAKVDFDSANNFSNYQSFAWLSKNPMKVGKALEQPQESLQPALMAAIRASLEADGYQYVGDASSADFLLAFTVGSREKSSSEAYSSELSGVGGRGGWATAYYGGSAGAAYTQGVLAIDIIDAGERQPVWHGVAGKRMTDEDRENMARVINEIVASILDEFPPR
jgi:uncharacterized protein DUF4136